MSYEANYDTAVTYLMAGLKDRARESLLVALNRVDASRRVGDNVVYLRILTLLAKMALEAGARAEAIGYIEEGLRAKSDHGDLLFLKSLYYWDEKRFDEMFGTLVSYLLAVSADDRSRYEYEFQGDGPLHEVFKTLIPESYGKSLSRQRTLDVVRRLAERTRNPLVQRAYDVMQTVNATRAATTHERADP